MFPILAFTMILSAPCAQAQTQARVPDYDKVTDTELHILSGTVISLRSAAILFYVSRECEMAFPVAAVGSGVGKELIDRLGFGTPELRDVTNTALAAVIGTISMLSSLTVFPADVDPNRSEKLRFTFLSMSVFLTTKIPDALPGVSTAPTNIGFAGSLRSNISTPESLSAT